MRPFENRAEAGKILAERLAAYSDPDVVVLALPRGGLPVAAAIAEALHAPLDILAVKKIGAPGRPELAIGAVSEDGVPLLHEQTAAAVGADRAYIRRAAREKAGEVRHQAELYRQAAPRIPVQGKVVILVDDGLATGATMEAAVRELRRERAARVVVAVPVASREAHDALEALADEVVALIVPPEFYAVGAWYHDFSQVTDEEAMALLRGRGRDGDPATTARIEVPGGAILGDFQAPPRPAGVIVFAHGSGSSRMSPRNRFVAEALRRAGFATLLLDLLTEDEARDRRNVFAIELLAERLALSKEWVRKRCGNAPVGYFGASTGAAAALEAAAREPAGVYAVVSRGGRPDLASAAGLERVRAPALLLVGGDDGAVLSLNRKAAERLPLSKVEVIPGAGHLFEEEGKLEEVVARAVSWFREHLPVPGALALGGDPRSEIARLARPITGAESLRELAKGLAGHRVVMLGESTHGTQEFYRIRRELSQILIQDHGFSFLAVEGDWPDCYELDRCVRGASARSVRHTMEGFRRWPAWMWANEEVGELVEWMRGHRAGFYGLDVYSLFESIRVIRRAAMRFGAEQAAEILRRYSCFEPFERDEISYARSLLQFPEGCRDEVSRNLQDILKARLEDTMFSDEELFNARQNARVIRSAEGYYRAMLRGDAESWNVRDRHMMETLSLLLERHGPAAKAIVWAHNTHIGDYRATDMVDEGYVNLGGLARENMGEESVALVGFGTYGGELLAGPAWGAAAEVMRLPDAKAGSWESHLHAAAHSLRCNELYLELSAGAREGALGRRLGHRAVGVVYSPAYELSGRNYVPTELARRYDAFVFVDRTTALQSLRPPTAHGLFPETWPSGL